MNWILTKYIGDGAIYAKCPECGFEYNCSVLNTKTLQISISKVYNYCPDCGAKAENSKCDSYEVIWNESEKWEE